MFTAGLWFIKVFNRVLQFQPYYQKSEKCQSIYVLVGHLAENFIAETMTKVRTCLR